MNGINRKLCENTGKSAQSSGKSKSNQLHHRAGRWLDKPKQEHGFVLEALKVANIALDRAASTTEVMQALAPREQEALKRIYDSDLVSVVSKVLVLLAKREEVFIAGKVNGRRYYGAVGVFSSETIALPDDSPSRRRRVFELVRQAVQSHGRALRLKEILDFTDGLVEYRDLTPKMICRAVLSLKEKGSLRLVGAVRSDGKGFNLYLPSELAVEDYLSVEPTTWLGFVVNTFREIWREHLIQAEERGGKPLPITTGEVRARILESGEYAEKLRDVMVVANAMQQLATTSRAVIRKIKRPKQKAILWIPVEADLANIETGDAYAHDAERLGEAVRRAGIRFGRPVNLNEIKEEIKADSSLLPVSSSRLHELLTDTAKEKVTRSRGNIRPDRVIWRIHRIGRINGKAYFYHLKSPEAEAYVKYRQLELLWNDLRPDEQLVAVETCGLKTVAAGRIKLLAQETNAVLDELNDLQEIKSILGIDKFDIERFGDHALSVAAKTNGWWDALKRELSYLPQTAANEIIGWTAQELAERIQMFYPRARTLSDTKSSIQGLIADAIRRIPNPDFKQINDPNPRLAAEYLYDETDAKIYIAKEWGGAECRLQAVLAANELGLLRDSRFVAPGLESRDYSLRLSAIACLAFLPSESGNSRLREVAVNDADTGVRQSALWAYGFAEGENAIDFIEERAFQDRDERVRRFVKEMLEACKESWFLF